MAALWIIGQAIIFLPCGFFFFLSIFLFFSTPDLSRRRLDVCHTSTHGVALVRISDAGFLKRAARGSPKIQDAKSRQRIAIWAPSHNYVGLYLSQLRQISTIGKNIKQQYLLHMSSQCGELRPTSG